ncbi:MAG TPA: DUF2007 domain-containing protein [Chitinophagaceae bacterium]|nr:DUF2007 domain-containing protein [Chitinophagaceae bacterium]
MDFIPILSFNNYIDAHIVMGRLEQEGINCWLKDENTVTIDPILTNAVGGIKIMVYAEQAERAKEIIKNIDEEKKQKQACPFCGSHNIEFVTTPRKPGNWLSVLFGLFWSSFAMPIETTYHCFDCGKEFEKPLETGNPENPLTQ